MEQQPAALPSVTELGQALATPNDWRAIVIVMAFVIISLMGFIVWREINLVSLRKSIDKVSDALWLLRLTMIEKKQEHDGGNA
jgi:hypothetical protein